MNNELDFSNLKDLAGIEGINGEDVQVYQPLVLQDTISNPNNRKIDQDDDYELVRRNLHYQSQMLLDMAKIALENAKNADSPRHVEVFATLMGQMTTTNKEMLRMHKEMKEIAGTPIAAIDGQVQRDSDGEFVEFEGSPDELLELETFEEEDDE
ncbi:terminase small subunit [Aeromonas phage B614]|nr:terminase small subunit [Aeromonas phage B614]UYD58255.1 terminase small subunit [Aeromonas phage UP87]UYD58369.1 terminase small subunit [Aeromonas phage avDM14-QBC]UYD58833.1 terminase small subunit [Aeromonas phage avDM10-HWA]UYD59112.1 terminase small subunit [Aeromonas phage avDM7-IJDJ]UYD59924.1 terminase small subunit [Aeromonas phage avDM9-HANS]